jgi:hypothetical protein
MRDLIKLSRDNIMDVEEVSFLPLRNNNHHSLREGTQKAG